MNSNNHQETLDFLSNSWCNFAIQSLKRDSRDPSSIIVRDSTIKVSEANVWPWAWKGEENYGVGYQKKKMNWMTKRFEEGGSIKKWVKESKEKRKEEKRLQKAQVHAAVSIAGLATALAALAEMNKNNNNNNNDNKNKNKVIRELDEKAAAEDSSDDEAARKVAMASATALIASQCEQAAKLMGAKTFQLSSVLSSALKATTTTDILTLTAAASTSLRGAATLKARSGGYYWKNIGTPVLPIELMDTHNNTNDEFDFERATSLLSKGLLLSISTPNGKSINRLVSLHINNQAKVILRIMRRVLLNVITTKKECLVLNMEANHDGYSRNSEFDNSYLIILRTTIGRIKLNMGKDYETYKNWMATINQMLRQ